MIEHEPWVGSDYEIGLDGQRIAIVGYSHHHNAAEIDGPAFTNGVIECVISGELRGDAFFSRVRNYFDFKDEDTSAFWNHVMFFNYLPNCIGATDKKYNRGTELQINRAKERFLGIIQKRHPQKVFVSTAKGWTDFPPTHEEQASSTLGSLGAEFPKFSWGTYHVDGHVVMAFGLMHPQYANGDLMRNTVRHILRMPLT